MTLLDVRTQFVESSGRRDLVVDLTDYADNGADWYLNRAQRMLDRMQPTPESKRWFMADLASGDAEVIIPGLRALTDGDNAGVWVVDTDNTKYKAVKKTLKWTMENYDEQDSALDAGRPLYYCLRPNKIATTNVIVNGAFTADATWSKGASWSIASGVGHVAGIGAGDLTITDAAMGYVLKPSTPYLVTFELTEHASGGVTPVFIDTVTPSTVSGTERTANGVYTEVLTSPPVPAQFGFSASAGSSVLSVDNVSVQEIGTYGQDRVTGRFNNTFRSITLMPPADAVYSVNILADFYSDVLSEDGQETWWTEEDPLILVYAANYILENYYRNRQGAADWYAAVLERLRYIDFNEVEEEIASINQMEG